MKLCWPSLASKVPLIAAVRWDPADVQGPTWDVLAPGRVEALTMNTEQGGAQPRPRMTEWAPREPEFAAMVSKWMAPGKPV